MAIKRTENIITDTAWERLHHRLQQDGLLPAPATPLATPDAKASVRRNLLRIAATAALSASILSPLYFAHRTPAPGQKRLMLHNEANALTLATMLHDGSVVYLSEQTSLTYPPEFDGNRREVSLNGEAFFEINRNDGTPFFIDTDPATIEVTGTAFNVKSNDRTHFALSVRDGEVRVSLKMRQQTLAVKTGETVVLDARRQLLDKTTHHVPAGRFRRIHFKDERLANMAAILNAHSDTIRLQIDAELGNRRLTMPVNFENSLSETAEIICLALNLHCSQQDHTIRISPKK